eukprot:CAMPEP_0169073550 /NCGR_PEP_ID=MMETSP1015-20121227/6795_1 /TAXON_ID=342587 /ORGANISM="Karlodinium micrum, Strain CCMP2283" /LENGTH=48 /DNA_ID= /DNA_START= /DNA_END= /DNA_ORIENTATION=
MRELDGLLCCDKLLSLNVPTFLAVTPLRVGNAAGDVDKSNLANAPSSI